MPTLTRKRAPRRPPQYAGLRMTADEYLRLEPDGYWYELVDGVVILSPSPTPQHQQVALEVAFQIKSFLRSHPSGSVYLDVDVRLHDTLVYRPDLVYLRAEYILENWELIKVPPDLVLEVVSPKNRRYDIETKMPDYERFGVGEFWLIDPPRRSMHFYRLESGRYVEAATQQDRLASTGIPEFTLDLAEVRKSFDPLRG